MNGIIELEQMEFYAYHGCFKEEQMVGNKFTVDISFTVDCNTPIKTDRIEDAINYVSVYQIVKKQMYNKSHLLENITGRIITEISKTFPSITKIRVKVSKINPPVGGQMKSVSVTLEL
ncbi:MAG: dihydroneopterin aldolase [Marinilabiliaceae bacterium]|nr:dihydroneopterin aldolase [Marinilabiliaceae bacterium]